MAQDELNVQGSDGAQDATPGQGEGVPSGTQPAGQGAQDATGQPTENRVPQHVFDAQFKARREAEEMNEELQALLEERDRRISELGSYKQQVDGLNLLRMATPPPGQAPAVPPMDPHIAALLQANPDAKPYFDAMDGLVKRVADQIGQQYSTEIKALRDEMDRRDAEAKATAVQQANQAEASRIAGELAAEMGIQDHEDLPDMKALAYLKTEKDMNADPSFNALPQQLQWSRFRQMLRQNLQVQVDASAARDKRISERELARVKDVLAANPFLAEEGTAMPVEKDDIMEAYDRGEFGRPGSEAAQAEVIRRTMHSKPRAGGGS